MEDVGVSLLCLKEHIKPSVLVAMNIYDNPYWQISALSCYTDY